ncbi:unnamed protein product [Cochlearia groenlandica]
MGTHINFSNLGRDSKPLASQSSLTFDEFQSTLGEQVIDFGSMNMDELLKNIWTSEETQAVVTPTPSSVLAVGDSTSSGLQRQGSLKLPRTLGQKTVDEVWRNLMYKESGCGGDERQRSLGEMTLEDFLLRVGVVREDTDTASASSGFEFGQQNHNNLSFNGNNSSLVLNQSQASGTMQQQQRLPQANVTFAGHVGPVTNSSGGGGVVATSPGTSSAENNAWSSPPIPYEFGRGRRSNTGLEVVVERRQRRMIKNRESAARSRARKQAYTLELEAEIENLKQLNQDLQTKQAEIMKTQKNELKEPSKQHPWLAKTECLRRTLTSPW